MTYLLRVFEVYPNLDMHILQLDPYYHSHQDIDQNPEDQSYFPTYDHISCYFDPYPHNKRLAYFQMENEEFYLY